MPEPEITDALDEALCALLPRGVSHGVSEIPERAQFAYEEEAVAVKQAGQYRQREFTAGRACARAALSKAGFSAGPIVIDADGLPIWPEGARAVITHSRGYCAAIAARATEMRALGLDLEKTNRLSPAAMRRVVHPAEADFVHGEQKLASLLFCAKEAFYKAQYPEWETSANFQDVALSVELDAGQANICYIHKRFPEALRALSDAIQFRFRFFGEFVVCVCWLKHKS